MSIPKTIRTPMFAVEIDSSRALSGAGVLAYQALLIGGRTSGGSVAEKVLKTVSNADQAAAYFGDGSHLHLMAIAWFAQNPTVALKMIALDDSGTGVPATGKITLAGTATAAGTLSLYIGGQEVNVVVAVDDAHTDLDGTLAAAINAVTSLPVVATDNEDGSVGLTAKNDGTPGNEIDIRMNYASDEATPAGLTVTIAAMGDTDASMTAGANNPDVSEALDAIGDEWFQIMAMPWTDSTSLTAMTDELETRFGPLQMIDGVCFVSVTAASLGALSALGNAQNSPHLVMLHSVGIPNTPWEYAAGVAAIAASEGETDPARPFQTLTVTGILAPAIGDRYTQTERNTLLTDGVSTFIVNSAGKVTLERLITTYQTNAAGGADTAYLDLNTPLTLLYLRWSLRNRFLTRYPRAKLASDAKNLNPGQVVVTPKLARAEVLSLFDEWEKAGLVEDADTFAESLTVSRASDDVNRLEFILQPDLVNQFRVGAAVIQFLL
ncbi:phage tail sheath subtilisin-like domain-containing protein [bacterium]|nr:phage tail sheath subtilisin-like domain-containing protein [bacterium]